MPVERAVNLALSGREIKNALLDKIGTALNRDCNLNDNTAYDGGFEATVTIKLRCKDISRTVEMEKTVTAQDGDPEETAALELAEAKFEMNSTDPNTTRVETGQPVPVATKDGDGKDQIRQVTYSRNAKKGK